MSEATDLGPLDLILNLLRDLKAGPKVVLPLGSTTVTKQE